MNKPLVALPALLVVVALAGQSDAAPVNYDNSDGTFVWKPYSSQYEPDESNRLDITQSKTQSGTTGIRLWVEPPTATPHWSVWWIPEAATDTTARIYQDEDEFDTDFYFANTFRPGDSIGSSQTYDYSPPSGSLIWPDAAVIQLENAYPDPTVDVDLGSPAVIGVRITKQGQTHYGWIELVQKSSGYQPRRWGYETSANTAITLIPEPAAATLMFVAALAMACAVRKGAV